MKPPNPNAIPRLQRFVPPVLLVGLALTLLVALLTRHYQVRQARARVETEADLAEKQLSATIQAYRDILLGFRGQAARAPGFSREGFHAYCQALELGAHHPGLLAITYGVPVAGPERDALEQELRRSTGDPAFTIHPPGRRERHFVLTLAEPPESNRGAVGMDTLTLPGNAATLDLARDDGGLVITGPVPVVQFGGPDPAILFRMPVYQGSPGTVAERRRAFLGCLAGVFRVRDLVHEALGQGTFQKLDVQIDDAGPVPSSLFGEALPAGGYRLDRSLHLPGRVWNLHLRARPEWLGHQAWSLPLGLGIAGSLISFLLWGLMLSMSRTGQRARLLAQRMMDRLREEESRTEAMALAVPDPTAILDEHGRFLHLYGRHESVLGWPGSSLEGTTLAEALPAPVASKLLARVRKALATGALQRAAFELPAPGGARQYEARMRGMGQSVEGRRCVVLSIRDTTEQNRAEDLARTKQKLEGLGVLAGGIAHDFNNFLAAILGHINLAQETVGPQAEAAPMLRRAEASCLRAAELAHQMLAYSGKGSLKVDYLELNRVVTEMTELLAVSIAKKASLAFQLEPRLPLVLADAVQIQQVVMNLVTNASEALGDRGGTITLETRSLKADGAHLEAEFPGQGLEAGTYVLLRVTDTGSGMDPETLRRIFDPFFTTKTTGRGLGLSALLGILKGHGAGISIRTAPGQGASFTVLFPSAGPAPAAPVASGLASAPRALTGVALVADDEPTVREVMVSILTRRGMEVLEACDGQEALDLYEAHRDRIDLVLLDITMPRLDGNEAFRQLRARDPLLPVILLSGFTSLDVALPPPGSAPALFVQKPFRARDLEAAVAKVLRPIRE